MRPRTDIGYLTWDADPADDLALPIANQRDGFRKRRRFRHGALVLRRLLTSKRRSSLRSSQMPVLLGRYIIVLPRQICRFAVRRAARDAATRPVSTTDAGPRCCAPRWRWPFSGRPVQPAASHV